jgi:D-glycero-D-manno-heptose 1,7-bisphosphate phosphatase
MASGGKAVFLDRDGVLVVPDFRDGRSFAPTSLDEYDRLRIAGFRLIVVTNQPDVGAGRIERDVVQEMHRRLAAALPVDAIMTCFHTRQDHCDCRKPAPGMILAAAREFNIDLARSFMIGDRASDIEAGAAAGCRTVFIDLGYVVEETPEHTNFTTTSLNGAITWILSTTEDRATS